MKGDTKKMKKKRKLLLCIAVMSIVGTAVGSTLAAPTIGPVTLTPEHPSPLSNITFSVDITGDDITAVYLIYKECDPSICKVNRNISMEQTTDDTYEVTTTLTYNDATYITYHLEVNSNGTWTRTDHVNVTLTPETPDNGNHNNGTDGTNNKSTPGFEIILFAGAAGILLMLMGRKRYR
jgi:hypothetical protein